MKTLLAQFYSPDTDEAMEAAILDDWLAVLERAPLPVKKWVQGACVAYIAEPRRSRDGAPIRPVAGDILRLAKRAEFEARPAPQPLRVVARAEPPCTYERAIEIQVELGFISKAEGARLLRDGRGEAILENLSRGAALKKIERSGDE